MYRYILFDFDGTVFDTVEGITKCVQYALKKQGIDRELDELRCFAGPPLFDMFLERIGGTAEQAERFVQDYRERYRPIGINECQIFPGIIELLKELRAAGCKTAIATLKPQFLAEALIEREGISGLFDIVCGSPADGKGCTKKDCCLRAMSFMAAVPEETVLVGDTKYDVFGAHEAGIFALGAGYGYAAPGELAAAGADAIVPNIKALRDWLLEN